MGKNPDTHPTRRQSTRVHHLILCTIIVAREMLYSGHYNVVAMILVGERNAMVTKKGFMSLEQQCDLLFLKF